MLNMSVYIYK